MSPLSSVASVWRRIFGLPQTSSTIHNSHLEGSGDTIIYIIGPTDSGKRTLINSIVEAEVAPVGHGLSTCTQQVKEDRHKLAEHSEVFPGRTAVLVDTPGFDDTAMHDSTRVFKGIVQWIAEYPKRQNPSTNGKHKPPRIPGFVYLPLRPTSPSLAFRHISRSHPHAKMPSPKNSNYRLDIMPEDRLFTDAHPDDLIIVVMGMTGAGKSTFINRFCGVEGLMKVNHGLRSCTEEIGVATLTLPSTHQVFPNRRLVLVDTPGFDDTKDGEYEILRRISVWLASAYGESNMQVKVAGFVYLHNIAQNRMGRTSLLAHDLFRRICGSVALGTVVMASTHWEALLHNPAAGPIRENDLKEFLTESLSQGAVYRRIDATDPRRDIGDIIAYILRKRAVATQIQEELVELGKRVAETEAARKLRETLESWLTNPQ